MPPPPGPAPNGVREYTLTIREDTEHEVAPGIKLPAWTFNGTVPGPVLRATAGRMIGDRIVANPGGWGNALRIDIDYRTADPATQFNLIVSEVRLQDGIAQAVRTEVFRNLTMTAGPNNAIAVVNAGSALITLDRDAGWGTDRPGPTGFYSDDLAATPPDLTQLTGQGEIDIDFGTGAETVEVALAFRTDVH